MLTLYYAPRSRAGRIVWLLEELGVPYERKTVSIKRGDGSGARDGANPHPHGKVPLIDHDGEIVFETPAIVLYLTDAFAEKHLAPRVGEKTRAAYLSWLAYSTAVIEPALVMKAVGQAHRPGVMGWGDEKEVLAYITAALAKSPYILGENFTAADIVIGGTLNYMMMVKLVPETEIFKSYTGRLTSRPAFKKMQDIDAHG